MSLAVVPLDDFFSSVCLRYTEEQLGTCELEDDEPEQPELPESSNESSESLASAVAESSSVSFSSTIRGPGSGKPASAPASPHLNGQLMPARARSESLQVRRRRVRSLDLAEPALGTHLPSLPVPAVEHSWPGLVGAN